MNLFNTELMGLPRLRKAIDAYKSDAELIKALQEVEIFLPISASNPELPFYVLLPPTFDPRSLWPEQLSSFRFDNTTFNRLFRKSFMPLDLAMFEQRSGDLSIFRNLTDSPAVPLDLDYGISPYARCDSVWPNVAFTRLMAERYAPVYPEIQKNRDMFLSLGAVRHHRILNRPFADPPYSPITVSINTRFELDALLYALQKKSDLFGYHIWLRGQTEDYLLEDLRAEAFKGVCPWRTRQDSSLIPSIYRSLPTQLFNLKSYASFCYEYGMYSLFMKFDLGLSDNTSRKPDDPIEEFLNEEWYKQFPQPTFVVRQNEGRSMHTMVFRPAGDNLAEITRGATEIHDYHPIYRAIQQMFFMQHYGLPSNVLDITHNVDTALFFAQNSVVGQTILPVNFDHRSPVIYVFLLKPGLDLFIDSKKLSEKYGLLRPLRQDCGLIFGASFINRNDYSRYIAIKIKLQKPIEYRARAQNLFPPADEDPFLQRLLDFHDKNHFSFVKPWVYIPKRPD